MTAALVAESVAHRIATAVPGAVEGTAAEAVYVRAESLQSVCRFLHDDAEADFAYLVSIDVADFIDRFELIYRLVSLRHNHSAVLKVRVWGREEPTVPSVTSIWRGADLQEREIYDLMGVHFEGHPNLKRVMLWEGFPGHPWRKDFP
ncbi:MAG: NADH-quinone oxidoreductase subunit C [Chloroflexi bacterium]|nr:NADH-quinone oxidoreductase subunit C [Chloroflexota bacterium]